MPYKILVVAQDASFAGWAEQVFKAHSIQAHVLTDVLGAVEPARSKAFACLVILDESHSESARYFARTALSESVMPVVMVVPLGDVRAAVNAMRSGAEIAVERDDAPEHLIAAVRAVIEEAALSSPEHEDPRAMVICHERSPINELLDLCPQLAKSNAPILISGESGTGKELFARILHRMSERRNSPFVAVHCAAIPESLLESELFGHVRGAFSGATSDKVGHFEAANGGTIFLDEIASLPVHLQVKLLRVLEDGIIQPVGASAPIELDFRVIAASNLDIEAQIASGNFRQDLFYRLNVFPFTIPALRHRPMDIPVLAEFFIAEQNVVHGTQVEMLSADVRRLLKEHDWPGNVRELHNVIQRMCILKQSGQIEEDDLPPSFFGRVPFENFGLDVPSEGMDMTATLDMLEDRLLTMALVKASGNKARAARLLGLNRTTLVEKLKRKRIDVDEE
ncbi:MAG: sigma-54-dependent Fis family transcriptional regulator [Bradymonadaceae bacterium]|nr:sigma-54-dependent Fis family transcriptional regulator [Lujinxingiaceae bacterium]